MSLTYKISGSGASGGNVGRMLIFTVTLELDGKKLDKPQKEDLLVFSENIGPAPRFSVMGGSGGAYHVGFTPADPGQYWIDFKWRGTWANEPFLCPIKDKANKVADVTYTGAERKKAGASVPTVSAEPKVDTPLKKTPAKTPTTTTPAKTTPAKFELPKEPAAGSCTATGAGLSNLKDNEDGEFTIISKDAKGTQLTVGGHKFEVTIENGPEVKVADNGDGTYTASFNALDAGKYKISVHYKGKDIAGSPFTLTVQEEPVAGTLSSVTVMFQLRGKDGKDLKSGPDLQHLKIITEGSDDPIVDYLQEGRYSVDISGVPGRNFLDVRLRGQSIEGLPLEFYLS